VIVLYLTNVLNIDVFIFTDIHENYSCYKINKTCDLTDVLNNIDKQVAKHLLYNSYRLTIYVQINPF